MSLKAIENKFVDSVEYRDAYGGTLSNAEFVRILNAIVLDRKPDSEGIAYWVARLAGTGTRPGVLTGFSESEEFRERMSSVF